MTARFKLFGPGMAKSGTHSLAAVFRRSYRTEHEPEAHAMAEMVVARNDGRATDDDVVAMLRDREERLDLEANIGLSGWVIHLLDPLGDDFRHVLTIRHPREWLDSLLSHSLNHTPPPVYLRMREQLFGSGRPHHPAERALADRGLYTLDGYLSHWAFLNQRVIDVVDADRLLVVPTHEIGERLDDVAALVGIDPATLDRERAHAFQAPERHGVLAEVDPAFVADRIAAHCGDLLDRYFAG